MEGEPRLHAPSLSQVRWREEHPKCMPCTGMRLATSPMVLLVTGLALLTFLPYVAWNPRNDALGLFCKAVLTLLEGMMLWSYFQCVLIDAGTVPQWWIQHAMQAPHQHDHCRKSNLPKPPRAHYDSVTRRLVLNMDHFCPWVANTVGFYNRKFFVLFLVYTTLACIWASATSLFVFHDLVFPTHCRARGNCKVSMMMMMATAIDGMFGLVLVFFTAFHVYMVLSNETTIESGSEYDVGRRRNWEQVFGKDPTYWALPVWGHGPDGDGLHYPTQRLLANSPQEMV